MGVGWGIGWGWGGVLVLLSFLALKNIIISLFVFQVESCVSRLFHYVRYLMFDGVIVFCSKLRPN